MTHDKEATIRVLSDALEDALAVARQGLNANATMEERCQLHEDILQLHEDILALRNIRLTDAMIAPISASSLQKIQTLAAQMNMLRRQSVEASKAVHLVVAEVGHALTAAIIFDPWPGSGGRNP